MIPVDKPLVWLRTEIKTPPLSVEARVEAGVLLRRLQRRGGMTVDKRKQDKLEKAGWRVGSTAEFLQLSNEEALLVEMRLNLSRALRARRIALHLSQAALAKRLGSSQSRIAKMEAADSTVSIDLILRGLLGLGASPGDVAKALQHRGSTEAA